MRSIRRGRLSGTEEWGHRLEMTGPLMPAVLWIAILAASLFAAPCEAQTARPLGHVDPVKGLVLIRPFVLDEPYTYSMTKEPFEVRSGTVVVIEVDSALARPREVGMPILYAGTLPVELLNPGYSDGKVVGIVTSIIDLRTSPVFLGSDELPERVDADRGKAELAAAQAAGIQPFPDEVFASALTRGGDTLRAANQDLLYSALSDVILAYAHADSDWAKGYRVLPEDGRRGR